MGTKIIRYTKLILTLLCFYPILSFSNESFSDISKYQEELKIDDKKNAFINAKNQYGFLWSNQMNNVIQI